MEFSSGERVEYWSASSGKWILATVRRQSEDGSFQLDRKPKASPEHIRRLPASSSAEAKPSAAPSGSSPPVEQEEIAWDCRGVLKSYNARRGVGFISQLSGVEEVGGEVEAPPEGLWFFGTFDLRLGGEGLQLGDGSDDGEEESIAREVSFDVSAGSQGKLQALNVKLLSTGSEMPPQGEARSASAALVPQRGLLLVGVVEQPADSVRAAGGIISCNRLQEVKAVFEASEDPPAGAPKGAVVAFEVHGGLGMPGHPPLPSTGTVRAVRLQVLSLPSDQDSKASPSRAAAAQGATAEASQERNVASAAASTSLRREDSSPPRATRSPRKVKRMSLSPDKKRTSERKRHRPSKEDFWKCFPCKAALKGGCAQGSSCSDAHSLAEVRPLPDNKVVWRVARKLTPMQPMPMAMGYGMMAPGMAPPMAWASQMFPTGSQSKKRRTS
ncbi:unnamed protein product [Polarella glacialis]|uniref:C3H1-type domain-containing protein n=1 Tax=Polarella glacialis TaxID=89957 RepID=A0A813GI23_POLGL|nr:unnamed protein product [Polarella glacialis]